ncbi:uncharacterized protein BP5553_06324 [Venustampulla echinocandica]|uniref:Uncharacterized protein n=1 Tax=Venustampulla echinocandica TaxID=2656787 RepID=A0A370TJL3_9HELO|nr:uncharacterized protein BP5553_06324 [Venustampulla echinocandica]RDL35712.1 hypothetical protein BP5553_06324 [Venustampulla echinocandica]
MAQGAMAVATPVAGHGAVLTSDESRMLLEYEKIVQFRDAILAGTHPRIKIPPHLVGKQTNAARNFSSPTTSTPLANPSTPQPPSQFTRPSPLPPSETPSSQFRSSNNQRAVAANAQLPKPARSEIDPIFLEKSDDLIKAEMNLQRVRLERALREQIDQQRVTAKALLQTSESLPNFDISEVLAKAQALVAPSTTAQNEPATSGDTPASDSFDENTFYSSQHDSSDWSNSSQGQKEPGEMRSQDIVSVDQRPGEASTNNRDKGQEKAVSSLPSNNQLASNTQQSQSQLLQAELQLQSLSTAASEPSTSRGAALGDTSASSSEREPENVAHHGASMGVSTAEYRRDVDQTTLQKSADQILRTAFEQDRTPPVVRAHNLSPFAPQPARVSPLATAREPPIPRKHMLVDKAPPAQVAALQNQPGISSTDSSPKGTKPSEKKRGKKKKRKAKDNADTPDSPYIKPEPRSPSPFAVAPLPRPQKRQRQGQYAAELNYDEPRHDAVTNTQTRTPEQPAEPQETRPYEPVEDRYEPEFRRPAPAFRRLEREDDGYRRVRSDSYARRQSPAMYSVPYAAPESRPLRAASHSIVDRRVEEPRYYREPIPRASVRPDADRERSRSPLRERRSPALMGPPRQPVRIVIDEYGREYIDPTPVAGHRQSVAPPVRYREPEVVYERAPARTVSSRAPVEAYDDEEVIYRRPSPLSAVPRRVVTQPEYAMPAPPDYRSYREREYSVRPSTIAPPGESYIQTRGVPERRAETAQYEEIPRDYAPRAQIVREEAPREYSGRASVMPEGPPREYAARPMSVRPEAIRYEVRDDGDRGYPARAPTVRPEAVRYEIREEGGREYDVRAMSRRPEPIRYEVPREYVGRLQSVRPEPAPREYAGSVHPEARREVVPQSQREFSVRPVDSLDRREAIPIPRTERYYEEVPRGRPAEVAFIERPRARESSVLVYADDVRREVYR